MKKILIAQPIPDTGVQLLKQKYDVEESNHVLSRDELIEAVQEKDALVCSSANKIDATVLEAGKDLKVISNVAIGTDNIDIKKAGQLGVSVTNTPGVIVQCVAEFAFAHMLALARKVVEADKYVRAGNFKKWSFDLMLGSELKGKILGVIGFGSIGQCLVPIAKGFGMRLLYTNQQGELEKFKNDPDVRYVQKSDLLGSADFVVLVVPLTEQTKHLISYDELKMMKPTAFLINVARGPVVKEMDLVRSLQEGLIAGAGLDVYEFEPEVSKELLAMSNVVLTPHIGSAATEARNNMSLKAAENVIAVLEGKECHNLVNRNYLETK